MIPASTSTMSKKAAIAGIAISSISASDSWETQAFITGIALAAIIVQAILDARSNSASTSKES